ncbi:hypothetical protein [uncultured Parasphingorhabdus sp.]|uniref:hypothetical protein n=1 Tax=uncultured Parasphingorhabdus sp. TaxID=2709694 RepID=UPI0030DA7E97|tara:strand:- start:49838 stop:50626 length:789 start_codon:yes stop_codon:yes gene_type:complete
MAWPDFTELSFGYCFLRELESRYTHGGRFPKAPDFISQHEEATEGYDVEVAMDGAVPLFIQLKRSEIMTGDTASEFGSTLFSARPVYRMNLHRSRHHVTPGGHYAQHQALQDLESTGENVIYATSQIPGPSELSIHCVNGTVISAASAIFSPLEIQLPDFTASHHVSFYDNLPWAVVFSNEGNRFERRFPNADKWISQLSESPQSLEANRNAMRDVVKLIRSHFELQSVDADIAKIIDGKPEVEAAILAYFLLDAQLTFVKF